MLVVTPRQGDVAWRLYLLMMKITEIRQCRFLSIRYEQQSSTCELSLAADSNPYIGFHLQGTTINATCIVRNSSDASQVTWYINNKKVSIAVFRFELTLAVFYGGTHGNDGLREADFQISLTAREVCAHQKTDISSVVHYHWRQMRKPRTSRSLCHEVRRQDPRKMKCGLKLAELDTDSPSPLVFWGQTWMGKFIF